MTIILLANSCRHTGMQVFRASIIPVLVLQFHHHTCMYYIFFIRTGKWNSTNSRMYNSIVRDIDHTYNRFQIGALLGPIWLHISFS